MRVLNKRYLTFFTFFLIAGILLAFSLKMGWSEAVILSAVLGTGAALYLLITKKTLIPLLVFALCLGNFLFINQMFTDFTRIRPYTEYTVTGRVCDYPDKSNASARYVLADVALTDGGETTDFSKRVLLRTPDHSFEYGDIVTAKAVIYTPEGETMPGAFNNRIYLASRHIGFSVYSTDVLKTGTRFMPYGIFVQTRGALEDNIEKTHSPGASTLAKAMFLGIKNEIPEEITSSFSSTGISHILAISGLHIGIIALLLNFLLKKTRMKRDIRFVLNISLLVLYASITGFPVSVIRAALMTIFILVGRWKFARRDSLIFLSAAMLVILLADPAQLFMPGFLLSFGTVFGILCLYSPLKRLIQNRKTESAGTAGEMLCVSAAASAASYPMTAYYFNTIALIAPLANFIAVPAATVIVVFTGLSAFAAFLSVEIGRMIAVISESFIKFVVVINGFISQAGLGTLRIFRFPAWAGIAVFAAIFVASDYFMIKKRTKAAIISAILGAAVVLAAIPYAWDSLTVTFLDVGNGEAAHISYMDEDILVTNATESAAYGVIRYSERNGITYDVMVLTEGNKSHYSGALQILQGGYVKGEIAYAAVSDDIRETCRDLGIKMRQAEKYDTLMQDGPLRLTVLNDSYHAITLLLSARGESICLFSGHSAKRSDGTAVFSPVLRLASEGNETSVNQSLLQAVRPEYAVVSVGNNPYGLPDPNTLGLLSAAGVKVYRTDRNYSVVLTVDANNNISMRPMHED